VKILATKSSKLGSRFICWATGEEVSHVALEMSSGFIIHSTGKGVHITWAPNFRRDHEVVYEATYMGLMGEPRELIRNLMEAEGRPYDYMLLLSMGLQKLGLPVPNWNSPNALICTELICRYIFASNDKLTPGQIIDRVAANPTWEVRRV
jgi:hypothetical protein